MKKKQTDIEREKFIVDNMYKKGREDMKKKVLEIIKRHRTCNGDIFYDDVDKMIKEINRLGAGE